MQPTVGGGGGFWGTQEEHKGKGPWGLQLGHKWETNGILDLRPIMKIQGEHWGYMRGHKGGDMGLTRRTVKGG